MTKYSVTNGSEQKWGYMQDIGPLDLCQILAFAAGGGEPQLMADGYSAFGPGWRVRTWFSEDF